MPWTKPGRRETATFKRKTFLTALTASGAAYLAQSAADAQSPPPGAPSPSPAASDGAKPASAAALATATAMRVFDPGLSDAQIARIAADIDEQNAYGSALNPKKAPLRNADEPVTTFTVPE